MEPVVLHTYHNSLLASHQGVCKTFLTMYKATTTTTHGQKFECLLKHVIYAKEQRSNHLITDPSTHEYQLIVQQWKAFSQHRTHAKRF